MDPKIAKKKRLGTRGSGGFLTRKVPGLAFVEVYFEDGVDDKVAVQDLLGEVVADELLVGGVETEAGRQEWLPLLVVSILRRRHEFASRRSTSSLSECWTCSSWAGVVGLLATL